MSIAAGDIVPFTQARAKLSELADPVKAGAENYVALIDADRLGYCHRLEREHIHLLLIDDARRGLEDIAAGRTQDANAAIAMIQRCRIRGAGGVAKGAAKAVPSARKRG